LVSVAASRQCEHFIQNLLARMKFGQSSTNAGTSWSRYAAGNDDPSRD
jgi:hypothetical protein